jgi:hypothetical protein
LTLTALFLLLIALAAGLLGIGLGTCFLVLTSLSALASFGRTLLAFLIALLSASTSVV